ncbi:MAG TPA: TolC family protein [Opitutaceae bacterium]
MKPSNPAIVFTAACAAWILLPGCAGLPKPDPAAVQRKAGDRAGVAVAWPQNDADRRAADDAVARLLGGELTADAAVKIAVLNNRALQATFEDLGVSQADVLAAGTLHNPTFAAIIRWPNEEPRGPDVEVSLAADLLDGLLMPLRKQVANDRLAQTEDRVGQGVLDLAAQVKEAFYRYQSAEAFAARLRVLGETSHAALDVAKRQYDAGSINQLELESRSLSAEQATADLMRATAELDARREAVNRLLALNSSQVTWHAAALTDLPPTEPAYGDLESAALTDRLDLAAAKSEVTLADTALNLKRKTRFLPTSVDLGIDSERNPDGSRVTGPSLQVGLPIFDQGQAEVARLEAEQRRAQAKADALEAAVRSDVRGAQKALQSGRALADYYRVTLLPQERQLVDDTLLQYNAMQKSVFELLAAKESEVDAERAAIEAIRDYWLARVALERAVGGRLAPTVSTAP